MDPSEYEYEMVAESGGVVAEHAVKLAAVTEQPDGGLMLLQSVVGGAVTGVVGGT